jgi:hypothetical protein
MAVQLHFQMRQEMYVLRVAVRKVRGFVISRTSCFYNYTVPKTLPPYLHKWVCKVKGNEIRGDTYICVSLYTFAQKALICTNTTKCPPLFRCLTNVQYIK